ncbi:hypothetical protein ABZ848_21485 [Streptomyces sp. NPDC047081]|uniref:hypothetical protein n=1 Tax=Streptomyces sp. NPDC047081 TaxID=3154706 RepID=UPI0033FF7300
MSRKELHWHEVDQLRQALGVLSPLFTPGDRRALRLVFEAAERAFNDDTSLQDFDAKFIPGKESEQNFEVFKIEGQFRGTPSE